MKRDPLKFLQEHNALRKFREEQKHQEEIKDFLRLRKKR